MTSPGGRTAPPAWMTVVWSAAAVALLTGVAEAVILAVRRFALHEFINRSRDAFWLAPVAYLIMFALPGLVLTLLARRWPERWRPGVSVFPLVAMGAMSILALVAWQKVHPLALALLAIGVGIQGARMIERHAAGWARLAPRITLVLGLGVGALAGTMVGTRIWRERITLASLPQARAGAPNVLLIILDTVRATELSLYGYPKETTPALERYGREGVVFDQAVSTAPWTLPSHASIFTGHYPSDLSTGWRTPLDDTYPVLAEAFRNRGYATGGFVANLIYATYEHGLDRGFMHYEDHPFGWGTLFRDATLSRRVLDTRTLRELIGTDESANRKTAPMVTREFLDWQSRTGGRPFFAFLNFYDAHDPYLPPEPWFEKFAGHPRANRLSPLRRFGMRERRELVTPNQVAEEVAAYDGAIGYIDHTLDQLFTDLDREGLLDRTVVVVTADHGEELGEHGIFFHGHTLYIQALHVPLLVFGPGVPTGLRVEQPVSLRDLAATVEDIAGLGSTAFPGHSLARTWSGADGQDSPALSMVQRGIRLPRWYPGALGDMRSLVESGLHVIRGGDSVPELFDLGRDPGEHRNLAADTALTGRMLRRMDRLAPGSLLEGHP